MAGSAVTMQKTRAPDDTPEKRQKRGMRIRWAREILEPNRLEFSRKLRVDNTTIRDIESGKTNPGVQLALKICHSLRISLDYIVDGSLTGVNPEMAAALVADHPELSPPRPQPPKTGNGSKDSQGNTYQTTPGDHYAR
jgi:DNA-binding XRE family transcriptional regulator